MKAETGALMHMERTQSDPDPQFTPSSWALDPQKVRECRLPLILVFVGFCHHS